MWISDVQQIELEGKQIIGVTDTERNIYVFYGDKEFLFLNMDNATELGFGEGHPFNRYIRGAFYNRASSFRFLPESDLHKEEWEWLLEEIEIANNQKG